MAAFGGYTKTSYGGGDDGGGGFMAGSQQMGSQGVAKTYEDSLRPVTIKQLLDLGAIETANDIRIDGASATQITLVGQIRQLNSAPTNMTLRLDDGTGLLDVKKYTELDKQEEAGAGLALDMWVRVYGRCKSFNNKTFVNAHVIRPIENYNEVNYHMLEASFVHLYYTKGPLGGNPADKSDPNNANADSMFVDGDGGDNGNSAARQSKLSGVSADARRIFNFITNSPGGSEGVNLSVLITGLGLGTRDVLSATDQLLDQGLIYTTTDDETWSILEY